jgi:ribosome-associated protein
MGRKKKKTSHQWVREDQQQPEPEGEGEDEFWDGRSRTQRRDDARALDFLGQQLVGMTASQRARLPLSEALREAIALAHRITSHEATRRQMQFIGKLLRNDDAAEVRAAIRKSEEAGRSRDRALGRWHKRILASGPEAIESFLETYPAADRQRLRTLYRAAARDPEAKGGALLSYLYEATSQ